MFAAFEPPAGFKILILFPPCSFPGQIVASVSWQWEFSEGSGVPALGNLHVVKASERVMVTSSVARSLGWKTSIRPEKGSLKTWLLTLARK